MSDKLAFGFLCVVSSTLFCALIYVASEIIAVPAHNVNALLTINELDNRLAYLNHAQHFTVFESATFKELEGDFLLQKSALLLNPLNQNTLTQAVTAYRQAIAMAPAKANLWAKYALCKAMMKQFDAEFYNAFNKAFNYGGWEAESNAILIRIGLAQVQTLDIEALTTVKESMRRLYSVKPGYVVDTAKLYGQLHLACIWVKDLKPENATCKKELL